MQFLRPETVNLSLGKCLNIPYTVSLGGGKSWSLWVTLVYLLLVVTS